MKILYGMALVLVLMMSPAEAADDQTQQLKVYAYINIDDAERLATLLAGVGEVKAQAIVDWRELYGQFSTIEDLLRVKGIGSKTLEKNRDIIRLDLTYPKTEP